MRTRITVTIRSTDVEHPPYVYERATEIPREEFTHSALRAAIAEARDDYRASYPHNQGRPNFDVVPPVKVAIAEVE